MGRYGRECNRVQTGSGKTWTMEGDCDSDEDRGVVPRALEMVFEYMARRERSGQHAESRCKCSYLEIYNETVTVAFGMQ